MELYHYLKYGLKVTYSHMSVS